MDVLTHGLWGYASVYSKYQSDRKHRWVAFLFGVFGDIIPFAPLFVYLLFTGFNISGPEGFNTQTWAYKFAVEAYNYTHSLIIFGCLTGAVALVRKSVYWPMLAWGIHILMDIPTHPTFFQTPFLFPFSDYRFPYGVSWGDPRVFFINWIVLLIVYMFIIRQLSRRRAFKRLKFLNAE